MIQFDQILKRFDYLTYPFYFEIRPRLTKAFTRISWYYNR
jgi:hypothetical protein